MFYFVDVNELIIKAGPMQVLQFQCYAAQQRRIQRFLQAKDFDLDIAALMKLSNPKALDDMKFPDLWKQKTMQVKIYGSKSHHNDFKTLLDDIIDGVAKHKLGTHQRSTLMKNIQTFRNEWNVDVKVDNTMIIIGDSKRQADDACRAALDFCAGRERKIKRLGGSLGRKLQLLQRRESDRTPAMLDTHQQLQNIQDKHNVKAYIVKEKNKKNQVCFFLELVGEAIHVDASEFDANQFLQTFDRQVITETVAIHNSAVYSLLTQRDWFHAKKIQKETGTILWETDAKDENLKITVILKPSAVHLRLEVRQGDILRQDAACIVNSANCHLQHSGGIALAIANAAGQELLDECQAIINVHGQVSTGDAVITSAGLLSSQGIKHVVHCVPPRYIGQNFDASSFHKTLSRALELADGLGLESIAIPIIGSGIFNNPLKESCSSIFEALRTFNNSLSSLKKVIIIDSNADHVAGFVQVIEDEAKKIDNDVSPPILQQPQEIEIFEEEVPYQWYWLESTHQKTHSKFSTFPWIPYDIDQNKQIEAASLKQPPDFVKVWGDVKKVKNNAKYKVYPDPSKMIQKNCKTKYTRKIKREAVVASKVQSKSVTDLIISYRMSSCRVYRDCANFDCVVEQSGLNRVV